MQNKNAAPTSWFVRKRENRSGGGKVRKFSNKYANGMIKVYLTKTLKLKPIITLNLVDNSAIKDSIKQRKLFRLN